MTHHKNDEHKGGTETMVTDNGMELLQKYVGDMAALESHIEEAIVRQLDMTKDDATAGPLIREFHDMILGAGPLPLSILETRTKEWIAEKKTP